MGRSIYVSILPHLFFNYSVLSSSAWQTYNIVALDDDFYYFIDETIVFYDHCYGGYFDLDFCPLCDVFVEIFVIIRTGFVDGFAFFSAISILIYLCIPCIKLAIIKQEYTYQYTYLR